MIILRRLVECWWKLAGVGEELGRELQTLEEISPGADGDVSDFGGSADNVSEGEAPHVLDYLNQVSGNAEEVRMREVTLVIFLFFIAACVTPKEFARGDRSESEYTQDKADCELEGEKARTTGGYGGVAAAVSSEESFARVYNACMKARGYEKREN